MNRRRLVVVGVLLALVLAVVASGLGGGEPAPAARFASLGQPTTPYRPLLESRLTTSFYCPGVPANGEGTGGRVVVVNPGDAALDGAISRYGTAGPLGTEAFEVVPRGSLSFDLGAAAADGFVSALVEVQGPGALVEQETVLPEGTSVAPCANDASTEWTLAAGATLDDRYQLVLSNPFPGPAVVDLTFATATETRSPNEFQAFVIPPGSVRVVDIDQVARDESQLSVRIVSRRGERFVAGRALRFSGGAHAGASVALGAPAGGAQWLFADGELADGVEDAYTIVNPGEASVSVDVSFFPLTPPTDTVIAPVTTEVAAGRAVVVTPSSLGLGLNGRYGVTVQAAGDAPIVVEQLITRPDRGTSVVLGSRYGSDRWWVPIGPNAAASSALTVFNASGLSGTVTVSTLGPGGVQPLPSLSSVALSGAATLVVDLPQEAADAPLLVEATDGLALVVERSVSAGSDRRSGALAVPE